MPQLYLTQRFLYRAVRSKAAWALGKLTRLSTRVDPLVGDLLSGLQVCSFYMVEEGVVYMIVECIIK
jgi:hypothetical protein